MRTPHLAEGARRAYLDGELSPLAALRCAWHLRRCVECRAAVEEERRLERRSAELVACLELGIDVEDGWQRFSTLSGGVWPRRARTVWPATGIAALALLIAAVLLAPGGWREGRTGARADVTAQDVCCWDLDGGGPGDDGVFTLSREGQVVACVILYDDVDASRTLSRPDVVRFVSRSGDCGSVKTSWQEQEPMVGLTLTMDGAAAPLRR